LSVEGREYIEQHFDNPYPEGEHPLSDWLGAESLAVQCVR